MITQSQLDPLDREIRSLTLQIESLLDGVTSPSAVARLPVLFDALSSILVLLGGSKNLIPPAHLTPLVRYLTRLRDRLDDHGEVTRQASHGYPPSPYGRVYEVSATAGRRRLVLDVNLIRLLSDEGMSDEEIGAHLGVCEKTVWSRRRLHNIHKQEYASLNLVEIEMAVVRVLRTGSGSEGEVGVRAGLNAMGIHVRRHDVRLALAGIDRGTLAQSPMPLVRRQYRVPWINSLWHIDGHHKLILWKIVIHAAIDGFSRMVTFIQASNNNRADTVLQGFMEGVAEFGWPSRVRADYGKEMLEVKRAMERVRGHDRGSFIQGPSTRNQQIERLWVDLQNWTTDRYRKLFLWMESNHILKRDNPVDIWVLHFCYLPEIDQALLFFLQRWNRHGLRTAHHNSPRLIWLRNRLQAQRQGLDLMADPKVLLDDDQDKEIQRNRPIRFTDYGVDIVGRRATHQPLDTDPHVEVDPVIELEHVCDWLDSVVSPSLLHTYGHHNLWASNCGVSRYISVKKDVEARLAAQFPQLYELV